MSKEKKRKESLIKIIAITILVLLSLTLLSVNYFNDNNTRMGSDMMNRMHGYNDYNLMSGNSIFGGLFNVFLQLFWVLIIIALLIGVFILIKNYLEQNRNKVNVESALPKENLQKCPHCGTEISDEFKFCPVCTTKLIEECSQCHRKILWSWQCCPYCGNSKENETNKKEDKK